jgi:hypothetical protein
VSEYFTKHKQSNANLTMAILWLASHCFLTGHTSPLDVGGSVVRDHARASPLANRRSKGLPASSVAAKKADPCNSESTEGAAIVAS